MSEDEIKSLKKALDEERKARQIAEQENSKLKESLLQKESEFKGVYENMNDAFVWIDLQGNVIKMNEIAEEMFGYKINGTPLNLMKLVHPKDYKYTLEAFQNLMKTGRYSKYRSRIITNDEIVKTLEVNCSLVFDKDGAMIGAQGIARDVTQEIAVQELLEQQKKQLDIIFDNSPIGISLSKEKDDEFLLVNKALCEMLGYTLEEMKEVKVDKFTHPDDRNMSRVFRDRLSSGKIDSFSIEKRYIRKNGEVLWAKTIVNSVKDLDGKVKFQVAIVEDITENKLDKEKLIESENRLSSLISNLDSAVLLENEKREISIVNKKFCEIFSIPSQPEKLLGQDCVKLLKESKGFFEEPEKLETRINKLIKDKKVILGDELRLIDGRILERDYIPISQDREYKGHLWTYRDVTLSRNYRKSLETQKKRYSNIIANLKLGLVELSADSKVLSANKSFVKMTGFNEEEILGKDLRRLFKKEKIKNLIQQRNQDKREGKTGSYEFKFLNNLNEEKVLLVSAAPNFTIRGEIIGSIGIILDITHIKKLESQKEELLKTLERRNVELEEYAHIVSHDLKSPLRSISALTSWLKEDYGDKLGADGEKNINLIQEVVQKMEALINDILNYSSIKEKSTDLENVNVYELVSDIKKLLYVPEHIDVNIDENLPVIRADKVRLQQLFQNLISNAINYSDKEKGYVNINYREKKKYHVFSVADNGVGIAKEYHDKIFKVFESLGDHKDSTGIGLSIVKKIVDVYDGRIWLESEEGVGTTFFIEFKK
ncbi:PAS/PAC sensor signal transduction histidine kinase [Tenacibaculum sp. 190524A05c]|uniref:PAS domain S-box protein n=1 Tax=Tenacibaculum platacis TaxID=3137852 RepID=UPI0031FABE19